MQIAGGDRFYDLLILLIYYIMFSLDLLQFKSLMTSISSQQLMSMVLVSQSMPNLKKDVVLLFCEYEIRFSLSINRLIGVINFQQFRLILIVVLEFSSPSKISQLESHAWLHDEMFVAMLLI